MLPKGALERVVQPGPGFYRWPFLVEKVTAELAARHQSVDSQWLCHADEIQDGDRSVCVGVYQEGGLNVLDRPQRCIPPNSCPSGISAVSLVLSQGMCLPVLSLVFRSVHGPAGVNQNLHSGFGVDALEGRAPFLLPGLLDGHCRIEDPSAATSGSGSPVGDRCQLGEV